MPPWLSDAILGKATEWLLDKLPLFGKRARARRALRVGDVIGDQSAQGRVAAVISQLLAEPLLAEKFMLVEASRVWLSNPKTQAALSQYLVARTAGSEALTERAFVALANGYSHATGEAPQLARGPVEAVASYVAAQLADDTQYVGAQVTELLAESRELRLARQAQPNLEALGLAARDLLEQAPKAASLLEQRIPCAFETRAEPALRERLDINALTKLLLQRRLVVIEGEGGCGKTTALVELGHTLLTEGQAPVPIYVSASSWLRSGKTLLAHMASFGGVVRAGVDEITLSRLLVNGKVAVLLNGWNEIAAGEKGRAIADAEDFLAGHPGVFVACTSRRAEGPFAASGASVVSVLEFNWERQRALITQALPGDEAEGLLQRLKTDTPLRLTARNPLVLSSAILLAQKGRAIPATMFDLLDAVQPVLETVNQRQAALREAPLLGQQRTYLMALARAMTAAGAVDMPLDAARRTVGTTLSELQNAGQVNGTNLEPADLLDALCDTHLLHRDRDATTIKFAHQKFQEFFAATWVLGRLGATANDAEKAWHLTCEVFNWPAWTEALDLAAEQVATSGQVVRRVQLVELAMGADLTLACKLAGRLRLSPADGSSFKRLAGAVCKMYEAKSSAAQRHALVCMALTRSPQFATQLIAVNDDQQKTLGMAHDSGGLSILSFGDDLIGQFKVWPTKRRQNLLHSLGSHPENLTFLSEVATQDPEPAVRAQAISSLAWDYPASDAALEAWFAAPDEVKLAHEPFNAVLYLGSQDCMSRLLPEVQRLAKVTNNSYPLLQLARELPMEERGFAVEAAKDSLRKSRPHVDEDTVVLLAKFDPESLQTIAEEELLKQHVAPDWVAEHLRTLDADQRSAVFERLYGAAANIDGEKVDAARIGGLPSTEQVSEVLGAWLALIEEDSPSARDRKRVLSRILGACSTDDLTAAVTSRKGQVTYKQVRQMLELLGERKFVERDIDDSNGQRRVLSPDAVQNLNEAYWDLIDPTEPQSHGVKAALCFLMSRSAAQDFIDPIFEGLMLAKACRAAQVGRRGAASGFSYGHEFAQAAVACGTAMAKRLLPMLDTEDAADLLFGVVRQIVIQPWPWLGHHANLNMSARQQRQAEGAVRRTLDQEMQVVADEFGSKVARRLEDCGEAPVDQKQNIFYRRWWLMNVMAALPTTVGGEELKASLIRADAPAESFVYALNSLVNQGADIDEPVVAAALRKQFADRVTSTRWRGQNDTSLEDLAALHFFVPDHLLSAADLESTVDQWAAQSPDYVVVRKLREVGTPLAMVQLSRLSKHHGFRKNDEALHALMVDANGPNLLLEMASDGSLFNLVRGHLDVRQVVGALVPLVRNEVRDLHRVLHACAQQGTAAADELAFELVAALPDPDTLSIDYLLRVVDSAGQNGKTQLGSSFGVLFEKHIAAEGSPNTQNVYPRSHNYLRAALFGRATGATASAHIAAELLLDIEERRFMLGRPSDEPRHPDIASKLPWPQCLASPEQPSEKGGRSAVGLG